MSGHGTLERKVSTPHATIGCQELLATGLVSHSGFLRKQLTYRQQKKSVLSHINKVLNKIWVQRYVVLSEGSLYHYDSETSRKPKGCYSLEGFYEAVSAGEIIHSQHPWAFKITHESGQAWRSKYFASASEMELKKWQRAIRVQIAKANGVTPKRPDEFEDEDEDLNQPVYAPPDNFSATSITEDSSDDSEGDDYLEIDEEVVGDKQPPITQRPVRPLPATPDKPTPVLPSARTLSRDEAEESIKILNFMHVKDVGGSQEPDSPNQRQRAPARLPPKLPASPTEPNSHRSKPLRIPSIRDDVISPTHTKKPLPSIPAAPKKALPDVPSKDVPDVPKAAPFKPNFGVPMFGGAAPTPPVTHPKPNKRHVKETPAVEPEPEPLSISKRTVPKPPGPRPPPTIPKSPTESFDDENPLEYATPKEYPTPLSPKPKLDRLSWKDFYWNGSDRDTCQQILRNIAEEGVFLVREADQGDHKTLVCFVEGAVRKFKITTSDDGRYTIKLNWYFSSIEELLQHYIHNNLPGKEAKLTVPYNKRL